MKVIVEHNAAATGYENMSMDAAMARQVREKPDTALFRTYTWDPWCVSLGMHQSNDVVDTKRIHELGYHVVTRPTGGRAVLHANELTYAVAISVESPIEAQNVYSAVHQALHVCLTKHVPGLRLTADADNLREHYSAADVRGRACFTAHAKTELVIGNRKVVGSAQRVVDGVILQHGSILCGPGHEQIANVLVMSHEQREALVTLLNRSAVTISEALGTGVLPSTVAGWLSNIDEHLKV